MTVKKIIFFSGLIANGVLAATEELVVTGTYSPAYKQQLTALVTVLHREQLLQLSSHSLVDALRQVPSLWIDEQGGPGGITAISLRGAESNHTLVLLDGVQLNDPTNTRGGAFDVNAINIESVQRIEIIRGAQSSIYGSDALAGVIQIFTTAAGKELTQANASLGEDGYKTFGLTRSGTIKQLGYAFTAQSKDAGEPVIRNLHSGSSANNNEIISRLNWANNLQQIDFTYRYFKGERTSFPEQSGGPLWAVSRELDASHYTDQSSALNWQIQATNFWKSKIQASGYNRTENITSPGILPLDILTDAIPANGANTDFTRTNLQWINTLGDQHNIWSNIGLEKKQEEGVSKGYLDVGFNLPTNFILKRSISSAFINLNAYVTPDLLLQASMRRDDAENIAAKNSTQAGARYHINHSLNIFINVAEGFKLPSFFALGHPLVGNSELKPETATTMDAGLEWKNNYYSARMTYFKHSYRDLIDFDSDAFKNVNRSRVETSGVEADINWHLNTQWQLQLHGSYTDIDMLSSTNHLLGRPPVKLGSSITYDMNNAWKIAVHYLWVDSRFAASRYNSNGDEQVLNAYSRIDAGVNWQLNTQTTLSLRLDNIADAHYENDIGFPAMEPSAWLTIRFTR